SGAGLLAVGLGVLAAAPALPVYLVGWLVIGLGMAGGLYTAVFSTLGQLYGDRARRPIAAVTLFGGLASTTCWPLSAFLVTQFGWRGACVSYALIHLVVVVPLYLVSLRGEQRPVPEPAHAAPESPDRASHTVTF